MKPVTDLSARDARAHFLKGSSYFNRDFPPYISFEPILQGVAAVLGDGQYAGHQSFDPKSLPNVNYSFVANKDGRFAWRPYELIHPVLYASQVNLLCNEENWAEVKERFAAFDQGVVKCCSIPVVSTDHQSDQAAQVRSWWHRVEQESLKCSLEFSHILHTDVTDCYGSLYTHSIAWALHGKDESKANNNTLGDKIDKHIRAGRYGQTNGISQGSMLMDFVAELVLGYLDEQISIKLQDQSDFRILRYRDDYRIFTNSDVHAEQILKVISDELRSVGMRLGLAKTIISTNVVEGSIKPDKLAGLELLDLGVANAKTLQKQLLRLHAFGRKYPNSGALRRLLAEFHTMILKQKEEPDDLEVQVAIATDIAYVSPQTFPAVAGILSHLISLASENNKAALWTKVQQKMRKIPYNGYLEVWLQRVTKPIGIECQSDEGICKIVDGYDVNLWDNSWISNNNIKNELITSNIVVEEVENSAEVISPKEIELFKEYAWLY